MSVSPAMSRKPFGSYSAVAKDNLYLMKYGHLYTSPCVVTDVSARFFGVVVLTTKRDQFELTVSGQTGRYDAVALKPPTHRFIRAENVRMVSLNVNPLHPSFRAFRLVAEPGVLALNRNDFSPFDEALEAAYLGKLNIGDASELHNKIFSIATRTLPTPEPIDARVQRVLELLEENPHYTLEELACVVKLSYKRVSYLFAEVMGLPLRSYLLWRKLHRYELLAGSHGAARSMTEIAHAAGFVDSAHLCRTFQEVFGAPPSYFFANHNVKVFSWQRHNPMSPATQLQTRGNPLDRDRLVIEPHRSTASLGHVA